MTGFLLGLVFAVGVALVWAGAVCGVELRTGRGRLHRFVGESELPLSPLVFALAILASGTLAGLLVWSLVGLPVLALAGGLGGAYAPVAWAGRRRARRLQEGERAWPCL
jgi:hypothetical protein